MNTKTINETIAARAAIIKKQRGEVSPSSSATPKGSQKETLQQLAKSGNLVDLQTYLHSYTSLSIPAIEAFLALVKQPATTDSFENFCSVWDIQ